MMFVDMYRFEGARESNAFISKLKRILTHQPSKCLGIRLLANLNAKGSCIVVSYWPDKLGLVAGSSELHERIERAVEGLTFKSAIETYEITYET